MWQLLSGWRRNRYVLIDGTFEANRAPHEWVSLVKIVVFTFILTCVALGSFVAGQRSEMRGLQSTIECR